MGENCPHLLSYTLTSSINDVGLNPTPTKYDTSNLVGLWRLLRWGDTTDAMGRWEEPVGKGVEIGAIDIPCTVAREGGGKGEEDEVLQARMRIDGGGGEDG